jgi:hypothetical protein
VNLSAPSLPVSKHCIEYRFHLDHEVDALGVSTALRDEVFPVNKPSYSVVIPAVQTSDHTMVFFCGRLSLAVVVP